MSKMPTARRRALQLALSVAASIGLSKSTHAQTVIEYERQVDSIARLQRSADSNGRPGGARGSAGVGARVDVYRNLPRDSVRVGVVRVRVDSQDVALALAAAGRLAPIVDRGYGRVAERLISHVFVLRSNEAGRDSALFSGIADSTGMIRMRTGEPPNVDALVASWTRMAEESIADEMPGVRDWIGGIVPLASPTGSTWSDARIALVLAGSVAARDCADGQIDKCKQILGLAPIDDPAFTFYDAEQRRQLVERNSRILRRSDAPMYDRCMTNVSSAACDSLVRQIPPDAVPIPTNVVVRQSLVRLALVRGGAGAFERFAVPGSGRTRIERASKMPIDSVVSEWRSLIAATRSQSTSMDTETALSSLAWAGICACLALRSSRWR